MGADSRAGNLAKTVCGYAFDVQPGQVVVVAVKGLDGMALAEALVAEVTARGAVPYLHVACSETSTAFYANASEDQIKVHSDLHGDIFAKVDAYVSIDAERNAYNGSLIDSARRKWIGDYYSNGVVAKHILPKRWMVLRYPNAAMASNAQIPTRDFEDFYFQVCSIDYERMARAAESLKTLMENAKRVRIVGPGDTDISFSIEGLPAIPCVGKFNLPDGEVFTAPVRESVNGVIAYNTASRYGGYLFRNIRFEVKDGKIIEATCDGDEAKLNEILDTDEGARYFGEWSIGFHPLIKTPILDTLFDEKILGSFHMTPGNAYDECNNGNKSSVHWDLVAIQTPEMGGGEIWLDDTLVRRDGRFTLEELQPLSAEALLSDERSTPEPATR